VGPGKVVIGNKIVGKYEIEETLKVGVVEKDDWIIVC